MRKQSGFRGVALALLALAAVGLAACGQMTSSGPGGLSQSSHESTASPTGATTNSATSSGPSGQVTVSLMGPVGSAQGTQRYATSEAITVLIDNGLSTSITATDHHTNCTMVTLERQVNGAWQPVGRCLIMTATRMIPIAGGQSVKQQLTPQGGASASAWPAGAYRVSFGYSAGPDTETPGSGAMAYSAMFTIG